jgi:hypothetical protein
MPNSSESVSPAGAIPGSFPGFFGGNDGYAPSNVDMLSDHFSSSSSPTFRTRARAARRGGAGSSKARCSSSPVPGQVRSGPPPAPVSAPIRRMMSARCRVWVVYEAP